MGSEEDMVSADWVKDEAEKIRDMLARDLTVELGGRYREAKQMINLLSLKLHIEHHISRYEHHLKAKKRRNETRS